MDLQGAVTFGSERIPAPGKPPNLRRSCEACRSSKSRCTPSSENPDKCQRCLKDGRNCVFAETRQRPKRARSSKARVAEMESRLDSIVNILSRKGKLDPNIVLEESPSPANSSEQQYAGTQKPAPEYPRPSFADPQPPPNHWSPLIFGPPPVPPKKTKENDVIDKGIVTEELAEKLLADFQKYNSKFPFVIVDRRERLHGLRHERPFLLLAVLTLTSMSNNRLQETLELELRQNLSQKVVIDGEKSLDLLQGLLVYLAWYQFHVRPNRIQIYQLAQMAVTMVTDLGYTKPGKWPPKPPGSSEYTMLSPQQIEEKRAFLGSYYLSACLSIVFRKPISMKYTAYMGECCQQLAEVNAAPTDRLLSCFVYLQELASDVSDAFDYDGYLQSPPLGATRIELLVTSFRKRHSLLGVTYMDDINNNCSLSVFYDNLSVYINEIGLHATNPLDFEIDATSPIDSWYFSPARSDTIICSLEATKAFLDRYISLPEDDCIFASLPHVTQVVYAVLTLGQFARGIDSPLLDREQLRAMTNVNFYLDSLGSILNSIIIKQGGHQQAGYFSQFQRVFAQARWWAEIRFGQNGFIPDVEASAIAFISDPIDMNPMRLLEEKSEDSQSVSGNANPAEMGQMPVPMPVPMPTDEGWMDLMNGWAPQNEPSMPMFGGPNQGI